MLQLALINLLEAQVVLMKLHKRLIFLNQNGLLSPAIDKSDIIRLVTASTLTWNSVRMAHHATLGLKIRT